MNTPNSPKGRVLVLYAHPCPESFNAAVHKTVVDTLTKNGWDVDDCDLNVEGFQPVLTESERRGYHDVPENIDPVRPYVDRLQAADALIMVFPVWNFGYPAILKGFLDRVFLPDVSFKLANGGIRPGLTNIKKLYACTTYGGTRFRATLNSDPPRKCVMRAVWYACGMPKKKYLALYDMNNNTEAKLTAHLDRVRREMEAF
ncbi:NAD(P)H-dependent oxidoreductase [Pacificibacter marinus]|uniref:FMN-dependent NADH-azoreductase n=1 Tax=Pacificibacter marinus TaxID=658057 RepID=A0A1Y5REV3_9RHOB|nr:NAD(P)H-dependent oxidoreductase [Pacificibacter marinus]SEK21877.1 Putative NADPH-quinone reductase (modulator of drug activity B) [Pacificibacter marinus]SLN15864.1 FMN-dependent NADH-azoreductase [Pacificibacter marinus]